MTAMPIGWAWKRSTFSGQAGNCVELGQDDRGEVTAIGDSKHPRGPILRVTNAQFRAMIGMVTGRHSA